MTATIRATPASRLSRDSFRQLDLWTNEFLHPVKNPLGTLSSEQWDIALTAVQAWIGDRSIPRHVDTASRVLDRLLYEFYSHGAPNDRRIQMGPKIHAAIQAWLVISEENLDSTWGIKRAEQFCAILESWDMPTELERIGLMRIKQQVIAYELDKRQAVYSELLCGQVADQLLSFEPTNEILPTLDSYFRDGVHQALKLAVLVKKSELNSIVSNLLQRIDDLAELGILTRFPATEIDQIIDSLYMEGSSESTNKLSMYERKALHRRIVTKIATREDDDADAVDALIRNWRSNVQSKDIAEWKPFAEVVTNFYLRIRDPYKATKWLQIQEQIPTPEQLDEALELKSQRVTDDDKDTEFEELKALETIFSKNHKERVRQKLNLLNIWAERVHSRITPWRVTEILESLESEKDTMLDAETYLTVVKLWLKENETSNKKAITVAMRCLKFTPELLVDVSKLMVRQDEQDKGSATASAIKLVDKFEEIFDSIPTEDVIPLAENLACLIVDTVRLQDFIVFLFQRNVQLTEKITAAALSSLRKDSNEEVVYKLLRIMDQLPGVDASSYLLATEWLLKREDNIGFQEAARVLPKLFELDSIRAFDTLSTMFDRAKRQNMSMALQFLDAVEADVLAPIKSQGRKAPIPLSFYKRHLTRTDASPQHLENLMQRLQKHYDHGWVDLHPDAETSRKFMNSLHEKNRKMQSRKDVTDQAVKILERLIARYEQTDCTEEHYKPVYVMFDWAISDLKERNKSTIDNPNSQIDPFENDSRKAVLLLEKMHKFGIVPNQPNRSYVFNAAMEMVLSCRNKYMHFKTVMILKKQMVDLGIQPNFHTVIGQLRACERASLVYPETRKSYWGWHAMLVALNEARELGAANQLVYNLCFEAMYANRKMTASRALMIERMLEKVTYAAIADGAFDMKCRRLFLSLASNQLKRRIYTVLKTPKKAHPNQLVRKGSSHRARSRSVQ